MIQAHSSSQNHVITLEITSGQVYRGKLIEGAHIPGADNSDKSTTGSGYNANILVAEDNMNVQLKDITVTARDGRVSHLDQVYIRGSHVRFFIVPDMLRYGLFSGLIAKTSVRRVRGRKAHDISGMRLCSDREGREGEVLDWREEGRLSIGQEVRGVQEGVESGLRDEEGRSSTEDGTT